jgi:hypothetical protein
MNACLQTSARMHVYTNDRQQLLASGRMLQARGMLLSCEWLHA